MCVYRQMFNTSSRKTQAISEYPPGSQLSENTPTARTERGKRHEFRAAAPCQQYGRN